jgi:hypothetical protein
VPCKDTLNVWSASFDFGVLKPGQHNLVITVRDEANPEVGQMFGTWFSVAGDLPPPPPPPPPLPPAPNGPLFLGLTTEPAPATSAVPTVVVVHGSAPFWCPYAIDRTVLAPDHVSLTLRQSQTCAAPDSSAGATPDSLWSAAFALGVLKPGAHDLRVSIRLGEGGDSLTVHDFDTSFEVIDAGAPPPPPPPPPPIDSLTVPSPNPFADHTEIGLIANEDTDVQVAIFDVQGRLVRDIYRGPLAAGTRSYGWDGRRNSGERARAGVYFYRVLQPGRVWARRVVLLPGR